MKYNVAILGAGLLGKLLAWRLGLLGLNIVIFDQSDRTSSQSAAYVAAGMIAPLSEAIVSTPVVSDLGYRSLQLWPTWVSALLQDVFYQSNGSLVVWHPQDDYLAKDFERYLMGASLNDYAWWTEDRIQIEEPYLKHRFKEAIFLASESQIDGRQLLQVLADELQSKSNVTCYWNSPIDLAEIRQEYSVDKIIDARGMGAKSDWNKENQSTLRGIRGEVLRIYCPDVTLNRPIRLLHPKYQIYIVPKEQHQFVIGATEVESEDLSSISVQSSLELLSALHTVHPAFLEARVLESNTQLRPTLNHHNPEIVIHHDNKLISVNGLFRHGYLLAPAVVEVLLNHCFIQANKPLVDYDIITQLDKGI